MEMMEKYYSFKMTEMKVSRLTSSQDYQRRISPKQLKLIQNNFNWNCVTPIRVSSRDGRYYVFDGQHTFSVIKAMYGDNVVVPVQLYEGLTYEDEAKLTAILDRYRQKMRQSDVDNALAEADEEDHKNFVTLCESVGYSVHFGTLNTHKDYFLQNASWVFNNVYMKHDGVFLGKYLAVFTNAFDGSCDYQRSPMQKGIYAFMRTYYNEYDQKTLVKALTGKELAYVKMNANNDVDHIGDDRYAYVILLWYNKVASNSKKLPDKLKMRKKKI